MIIREEHGIKLGRREKHRRGRPDTLAETDQQLGEVVWVSLGPLPVLHSVDGTTFRNEASHGQRLLQGVPHSHSTAS